jgi:dihydrofolate reductase
MARVSIIVAISKNGVIGRDNQLPWDIPEDMKSFRQTTAGHPIIMGRKTFESIGRPLPNRLNIVMTRSEDAIEGVTLAHDLDEAIVLAEQSDNNEIFIIGGGNVYSQAIDKVDRLYLTIVDEDVEGDTKFPAYRDFKKVVSERDSVSNGYKIKFLTLERE